MEPLDALDDALLGAVAHFLPSRDVLRLGCASRRLATLVESSPVTLIVLADVCRLESVAHLRPEAPGDAAALLTRLASGDPRRAVRFVADLGVVPLGCFRGLLPSSARNAVCSLQAASHGAAALELVVPLDASVGRELCAQLVLGPVEGPPALIVSEAHVLPVEAGGSAVPAWPLIGARLERLGASRGLGVRAGAPLVLSMASPPDPTPPPPGGIARSVIDACAPVVLEPLPRGAAPPSSDAAPLLVRLDALCGLWTGDYGPHGPETLLVRVLEGAPPPPPPAAAAAAAAAASEAPADAGAARWPARAAHPRPPCPSDALRLPPRSAESPAALSIAASAFSPATPLGAGAEDLIPEGLLTAGASAPPLLIVGAKVTGDRNVPSGQVSFVAWAAAAVGALVEEGAVAAGVAPLTGDALVALLDAAQPIRANRVAGPVLVLPADLDVDVALPARGQINVSWAIWDPIAVPALLLIGRGDSRLYILWTHVGGPGGGSLLTELERSRRGGNVVGVPG